MVTILKGELSFTYRGTTTVYREGESFVEEPGVLAQARNASAAPTRVMASYLLPPGAPLSEPQSAPSSLPASLPNTGETPAGLPADLIDSPPSLGLLTLNTMAAADSLIVPLQAHVFALHAMAHLEETIALVQQLHPSIAIGGIVMTMVDKRTSVNQAVDQAARERYGDLVFQTTIPFNVKLVEAPAAGQPIGLYAPSSSSAQAYARLAQEVRSRYG